MTGSTIETHHNISCLSEYSIHRENDFTIDALRYYAKSNQFARMIQTLISYPFNLQYNACESILDILEKLDPDNKGQNDPDILLLKNMFVPLLLMGMGRYEEATVRSFDTIRKWEHTETPFSSVLLWAAYSNLTFIKQYTCTATHEYDAPVYLKKSIEYYKKSPIPLDSVKGQFSIADIRPFACPVGIGADLQEFDLYMEAARQTSIYIEETFYDMYRGYEELAVCEIAFFKNQLDLAKKAAYDAIIKANEGKQYSIAMAAEQYLLLIAMHEGDYPSVMEVLRLLRSHLDNKDFRNRQLLYDLYTGLFYSKIRLFDMVSRWLVIKESEMTSEVRIPISELIVSSSYCLISGKYGQALTALCASYPRAPEERFLFGELTLTLLTAAARLNTGDTAGATADFEKAYRLSFCGVFEMPFILFGKTMHSLANAALRQGGTGIPNEWLKAVDRKSSIHGKKIAAVANAFKQENKAGESVSLTKRELEVLNDLYHGLSREEIAANQYLSIGTVNKALESIYTKLDANSIVDAIRIALENKLIE